jgi:hypothetical protein
MADIVGDHLQKETLRPEAPQMITPFGIALSCLEAGGSGSGERIADHAIH